MAAEEDTGPRGESRRLMIAPSIMTADFGRLADEIHAAEKAGVDYIHLDIMDGRFVPNISFGPLVVEAVRRATSLPLDVHLMILEPERYVPVFAEAGATHLIVHQEACIHLQRQIGQIRDLGLRAGVAINPATALSTVEEVAADLDHLLIMSVNPGFGGQSFIANTLDKLRRARRMLEARGSQAQLQVDGGVTVQNIATIAEAGATIFVTGSSVYSRKHTVEAAVRALRAALAETEHG